MITPKEVEKEEEDIVEEVKDLKDEQEITEKAKEEI